MKNKRRDFIKTIGLTGASIFTGSELSRLPSNATVRHLVRKSVKNSSGELGIALIGAGGMGTYDTETCLSHDGIKLVAVCDLYKTRLKKAKKKWGDGLYTTMDYKAVLRREDIDAVIIGTPDHWHKQISIDAMNAGKHVYCEKPMVHSVKEGHELINAWKKSGAVFQVGSQGMSSLGNEKARELLAKGAIGDINYAEGFWARHSPTGAWQYPIPEDASEKTVDWKRYISNTTQRPFDVMRFFRWRNYLDYGTGMSGDLFVHLFSSLHFITNSLGPNQISAMGGLRYWKDGRDVPDVLLGMFQYPDSTQHPGFNLSLRCNFVDGTSGTTYLRIVGSEGSMDVKWEEVVVKRNAFRTDDQFAKNKESEQGITKSDRAAMTPNETTIYRADADYKGAHYDHFGNWIRAIRTGGGVGEDPVLDFERLHRLSFVTIAFFSNKYMKWDPVNMKVV